MNSSVCVWEGGREEEEEVVNGVMWGWIEKTNLLYYHDFHFSIYLDHKKISAIVLNISYFCEITIISQIRNLTDDRLLQKQYVPEPVFLSGWWCWSHRYSSSLHHTAPRQAASSKAAPSNHPTAMSGPDQSELTKVSLVDYSQFVCVSCHLSLLCSLTDWIIITWSRFWFNNNKTKMIHEAVFWHSGAWS